MQDDFTIDGITLDPDNKEFQYALDCALHTDRLIYLTGKAGTGKTTFLKYLRKVSKKKMVVLAPTGVAAINAKGQTIHSFFQIEPSLFVPDDTRLTTQFYKTFNYNQDKIKMIKNMEMLVIDEISMVRCDLLDVVDVILRKVRRNPNPFGGVQVILIGDTFQLPPVVGDKDNSKQVLYRFYDSEFFFSSKVIEGCQPLYIELKKIYRQNEREFIELLNKVRVNALDKSDLDLLNTRYNPNFTPQKDDNYITLVTRNVDAAEINQFQISELNGEGQEYVASINGSFPNNNYPTDYTLNLKVGAQVMFIKNNWGAGYFNGKVGKVSRIDKSGLYVEITNEVGETRNIQVELYTWENVEYKWNEEKKRIEDNVTGTFTQYPLKLAWAITVHKSQGMTFERVIADVGSSFAAGQVYVALSRCTSFNGLVLKSKIYPTSIKTDSRVMRFAQNELPETVLIEEMNKGKADFYYSESRKSLKAGEPESGIDNFLRAIKYRNDMETSVFRRFVSSWINRYFLRVAQNKDLSKKIDVLALQLDELTQQRDSLAENNESLCEDIAEKDKKISETQKQLLLAEKELSKQETEIEKLNGKLDGLKIKLAKKEELSKSQKSTINKLNDEIIKLNDKLYQAERENHSLAKKGEQLEKKVDHLNERIDAFIDERNALKAELNRVKSIKWYQKLFGKK